MTGVPLSYFEQLYRDDSDPWHFETSEYEHRKHRLTVACLPRPRYQSAFEPGCSIGVLSELLSERCDQLLVTDVVPQVVERAAHRLAGQAHVRVETCRVPEEWPSGRFDLVVMSELGYYFDMPTLQKLIDRCIDSLTPAGSLVGVHWRGETNYPLSGDEVHQIVSSWPALARVVHHEEPSFLLDVWERR